MLDLKSLCHTQGHLDFQCYFISSLIVLYFKFGVPMWLSDEESAYQCRRHRFDP